MKKLTLLLSAFFVLVFANAQSNKEEIDYFQSIFGMEKKAIVDAFVKVDDAQKDAFWKIYDEYEVARKELGKNRIALLNEYAANFDKMTNESADAWTGKVIKQGSETDKLLVTYYKKVKKVTNPVVALKFYQIESYLLTMIRMTILDEIPFVQDK
jgi:hypothetical protein